MIRTVVTSVPPSEEAFAPLMEAFPELHPGYFACWNGIVAKAFRQTVYTVEAWDGDRLAGVLPLVFMHSPLFGKHLISLPYLNVGGCFVPEGPQQAEIDAALIDEATTLADRLDVKYLELRNEREIHHPRLTFERRSKVLMRRALPETAEALWKAIGPKVRNQVRKGEKANLSVQWGGRELLNPFYDVFAATMRHVGTPVYSKKLFAEILEKLPENAEICVVSMASGQPVAAALLLHGKQITEVPTAGALLFSHAFCANMFLYWNLLKHTVETRHSRYFDFGRSSVGGNTWRFKKQWGAVEFPTVWKYYVRRGGMDDVRPDNASYGILIQIWKKLPLWLTRLLGPMIVRGIP
ncbi:MAG: FemAB family PEP-CTERM system-associated protein [Planctomycetia bacterium]|nr:FemAB family PEP-CTERM system-associated protein [Planctomycetia bacterium]